MPGDNYLDSIINMWRVYAGNTKEAANSFKLFFKKIINTRKYPMTELPNLISCETSKIIENSYRAANIAFIDEWSRFSENVGVDIYEVIEAIKKRPTHANIMYPGLGVGGYCLTKDPLFGAIASKQIHKLPNIQFPISKKSIDINNNMPKATVDMLEKNLKTLKNKIVLILGLSYRPDTDDIRYSPSTILASKLISKGAKVYGYDPLVQSWGVFEEYRINSLDNTLKFDAIILAVNHKKYQNKEFDMLGNMSNTILDANNILSANYRKKLINENCNILSLGRG